MINCIFLDHWFKLPIKGLWRNQNAWNDPLQVQYLPKSIQWKCWTKPSKLALIWLFIFEVNKKKKKEAFLFRVIMIFGQPLIHMKTFLPIIHPPPPQGGLEKPRVHFQDKTLLGSSGEITWVSQQCLLFYFMSFLVAINQYYVFLFSLPILLMRCFSSEH